jgi:peptidoglycan/xylan/chitin deacetylase (PgdA/CDA1 family)
MKRGRQDLKLERSYVYAGKAAMTRVLSLSWLARTGGRASDAGIRILFYHRVSDDRDELAVPPKRFRQQMEFLASEGFRVVDVPEVHRLLGEQERPPRVVGLSFDDGYRDIADNALPILAEHGFAASVFIVTGRDDHAPRFTWYANQPPLLSWNDISSLDGNSPFSFEAHTLTHPNLMTLDVEDARAEIVESKAALEDRLGRTVGGFSYPAGLFGGREIQLVKEAGYRWAVSCEPGTNTPATNPFALKRRQVDRRDRLIDFRAKVLGGHDSGPPMRGPYRRFRHGAAVGRVASREDERTAGRG